jgi:hypothetical protein
MSFLTTSRLFGKPARLNQLGGYAFDLFFLLFLWLSISGWRDLQAFSSHAAVVSVSASTFVFFGALGVYGVRVASYIDMIRRSRMPQTLEWLVTIIPLALALPCFVASGHLVRLDARLHGYRFCYRDTERSSTYTFAATNAPCPVLPHDAIPD